MTDVDRPHTAVMNVMIEVHDLLDTGECSGKVVPAEILKQNGINSNIILSVSGINMEDCFKKLKKKLKEFNDG
jgi:hypothetical protein